MRWRLGTAVAAAIAATAIAIIPVRPQAARAPVDDLIASSFAAAYNLDHDVAITQARAAVAADGNASRAHRALASVLWQRALFLRGAVTVDYYLAGVTRSDITMPKPPADLEHEFQTALARAIDTALQAQRANPRDVSATHDLGTAYGVQASWAASVEGRVGAAFGAARRAFDAEETVLTRDPTRVEVGAVLGSYRYAVASLGMPSRMVAYVAGLGGDKAKAIELLRAASQTGASRFEARTALVLIHSREGRHGDAVTLLAGMAEEFPRNRLLQLELGAAAIRAGRAPMADTVLTRGLAALDLDKRDKMPGEKALWLYKRGLARLNRNFRTEASVDYTAAVAAGPLPWVRGRLHLEFGKLADLSGHRADAVSQYRQAKALGQSSNDPIGVSAAERLLDRPFVMGPVVRRN